MLSVKSCHLHKAPKETLQNIRCEYSHFHRQPKLNYHTMKMNQTHRHTPLGDAFWCHMRKGRSKVLQYYAKECGQLATEGTCRTTFHICFICSKPLPGSSVFSPKLSIGYSDPLENLNRSHGSKMKNHHITTTMVQKPESIHIGTVHTDHL